MNRKFSPRDRFVVPILYGMVVVPLALVLLTIGARSPYTQANLNAQYDPSYTRTDPSFVGPGVPIVPGGLAVPASIDQVTHGHQLFAADGCVACHGLDGRGGVIGPSLAGVTAAKLRSKTHAGPGAMPPFDSHALSDDDLAAIAAYLSTGK